MADTPTENLELRDFPFATPAPPELIEQAMALVKEHHECFWFRHPQATMRSLEDVRLVVQHLREYGDHPAWRDAQELHRCLLALSKRKY